MDHRFVKRLLGDFAPSRGDLVLSQAGRWLGMIVNSDYRAGWSDRTPFKGLQTGDDIPAEWTGALLDGLTARGQNLPSKLG